MSQNDPPKPNLDEAFLIRHNITRYEDRDEDKASLPHYVERVKRALLEFKLLPRRTETEFKANLEEVEAFLERTFGPRIETKPQAEMYNKKGREVGSFGNVKRRACTVLETCDKIAEQAIMLNESAESDWQLMYRTHLFKTFKNALDDEMEGTYSGLEPWSLHDSAPWSDSLSSYDRGEKRPKPDLTYAFPVSDATDPNFPPLSPMHAGNFSSDFLIRADLKCLITSKMEKGRTKLKQWDRMCYPWAVMEAKHDKVKVSDVRYCYYQAVNSAAVSLEIRAHLYRQAIGHEPQELPPMIAFTCIGPCVEVLLVWRELRGRETPRRKTICIWATDLRLSWGVYSLRLIIENMHKWVGRKLKPELSKNLDLVREKSPWVSAAPKSRHHMQTKPSGAKVHRSESIPAVEINESSNSEADGLCSSNNRQSVQATCSPGTAGERDCAAEHVTSSSGSDDFSDKGSTTLVDSEGEEEELSNRLRGQTLGVPSHVGRSQSASACLNRSQRRHSPSASGTNNNHRGRSSRSASNANDVHVSDSDESTAFTTDANEDSEASSSDVDASEAEDDVQDEDESSNASTPAEEDEDDSSNAGDFEDEDSSSDTSQSDNSEYRQWAIARDTGLITLISRTLSGAEIMPLLCSGQAPAGLDKDVMVEYIETLIFRPKSGRLVHWFIHKNWEHHIEKELLQVVHLLKDLLARYDRKRRLCFPHDTPEQEYRIRKALKLLRTRGRPQEVIDLFAAILSCFSGKECLVTLEGFEIPVDDHDWGLLKQLCSDKAQMTRRVNARRRRPSSR